MNNWKEKAKGSYFFIFIYWKAKGELLLFFLKRKGQLFEVKDFKEEKVETLHVAVFLASKEGLWNPMEAAHLALQSRCHTLTGKLKNYVLL